MNTLGLIAAMPQESAALLRCIQRWQRVRLGSFQCACFDLPGQTTCLLVTSGMGVRRANVAARSLIEQYAPRALISFGIAGAVEADLQVGDVILAAAVCQLEQGLPGPRTPLAAWPEPAQEAAAQALSRRGARLFNGTAITTSGSQVTEKQVENMLHPILEMETAGIAQVAARKSLPLFSLRAISDGPQAPIPFDLGEMMDDDANLKVGRLLRAVARQPGVLFQAGPWMQNSRIAARSAAAALLAALRQPIL